MIGHIDPPQGSVAMSQSLLGKLELRLPEGGSGVTRDLYRRQQELERVIYDLLCVLHQTGGSKKEQADAGRAVLGMEPGAKMTERERP